MKKKLHPIIRYHYLPRTFGFLLVGVILAAFFRDSRDPLIWAAIVLQCLVWPQIAYLIGRKTSRPVPVEKANMFFEAFIFGIWAVFVNAGLWPTTAFLIAALVNTINTGGFKFFFTSTVFMAAGFAATVLVRGITFNVHSDLPVSIASMLFMVAYSVIVSYISFVYAKKLNKTSKKLSEANSSLEQARDRLWGEMELAKKIQTVLLPSRPAIDGYEISAYMMPADEVGGDYYDVINVDEKNWLVIGDVSGHGVPAGLIMMMVQTSIHTVLTDVGNVKPSVLLSRVNRVIAENIRKLEEDKYMTITVFACLDGGRMYFSGLHQDIMIYRSRDSRIEHVETNGAWIGIMEDIGPIVDDEYFLLDIGDVMLVYTDGITEAWHSSSVENRRSVSDDMFGSSRLADILLANGGNGPDAVKNAILDSLKDYCTNDDVTMLIAKRVR